MSKISVIVPVYNVEGYLEDSLGSLLGQTLSDIEVIAVDDGSTDGSRELLEEMSAKDPRIKLVSQENSGPSAARNRGIGLASSPIICFMDADDRFKPEACERITETFAGFEERGEPLDVLTFGADCFPEEASTPWHEDVLHPRDRVFSPFEPALLFEEASRPFHWRTALRAAFLKENGVVFNESLRLGEDQAFHFAIYPRAFRTALSSDVLYEYRVIREGSAMDNATSDKAGMMAKHLGIAEVIFQDWEKAGYLDMYPSQMASWLVEFMVYDTLFLGDEDRSYLLAKARDFILGYWDRSRIERMDMPSGARSILLALIDDPRLSKNKARRLQIAYYMQRYGALSAARGIARRIVGRG